MTNSLTHRATRLASTAALAASVFMGGSVAATAAQPVGHDAIPSSSEPVPMLLGAFDGTNRTASDFKDSTGKIPATSLFFSNFSDDALNAIPSQLTNAWNQGAVPILTIEFDTNGDAYTGSKQSTTKDHTVTPADVDVQIAQGGLDKHIDKMTAEVRSFVAGSDGKLGTSDDRKIYMRIGHEMNGDWYRWSATDKQTPSDYINAYRHIHEHLDAAGLTDKKSIQYIWAPMSCVSINTCGGGNAASYYPGNKYVDWVGVDAYNWGSDRKAKDGTWTWQSPETILKTALDEVSAIAPGKPLAIPETGTPSNAGGDKNQWFRDLHYFTSYYTSGNGAQIKMLNYFNIAKSENGQYVDWRAIDKNVSFSEFRSMVMQSNYMGGSASNHLTTSEFQGNF